MDNAKRDGAAPAEVKDLRGAIEWMKKEGDILITDKEVDPDLEITGIQKQLDGGCPILWGGRKRGWNAGGSAADDGVFWPR